MNKYNHHEIMKTSTLIIARTRALNIKIFSGCALQIAMSFIIYIFKKRAAASRGAKEYIASWRLHTLNDTAFFFSHYQYI